METIKLDLIPGKKMPSLHASQYDDGREHGIDLFENGVVYKLDGTETLTINERKGDDCICSLDIVNTFADSNHIVFSSTEQMCAVWGNNICELVIAKGEKTIGTLNFILEIEQSPTEGGIESESEIKNLERQIEAITEEVIGDDYYTKTQTDEAIATAIEGKADKSDTYTKTQVNNALSNKADKNNPTLTGAISHYRRSESTVGNYSVAFGFSNIASGVSSFAEGNNTTTSANAAHAEGQLTEATARFAHAEGRKTKASGEQAHAEGYQTEASGNNSHAEGYNTTANHRSQHVFGEFNIPDDSTAQPTAKGNYVEIVGNGTAENNRSNARTLDWGGNETLMGDLTYNRNKSLTSEISRLDGKIDNLPAPMIFKGTLGVGGTIQSLPTASADNEGFTYKVITDGTYAGQTAKVGDVFTSNGSAWVYIPSGDEDNDTWRAIKVNGVEKLGNGILSGAVDFEDTANVKFGFDANGNKISATLSGIYTSSEVNDLLDDKADADNTYTKAQVDDIVYGILPDDTASGSVANFTTSLELPIKSLEVDVNAVQESGTPTPETSLPISGRSEISVVHCGKNLFNLDYLTASNITIQNGEASGTARAFHAAFNQNGIPHLKFKENTRYTLSFEAYTGGEQSVIDNNGLYLNFVYTDNTTSSLPIRNNITSYSHFSATSLSGKTVQKIIITFGNIPLNVWHLKDILLEENTSATSFEPFNGNTEVINLGGTYYGGHFTQDKAGHRQFAVDRKLKTIDGSTGVTVASSTYIKSDACDGYINDDDIQPRTGPEYQPDLLCNRLTQAKNNIWSNVGHPDEFCISNRSIHLNISNTALGIVDYTQETTATAKTKIDTFLQNNPVVVVIPITPYVVNLPDGEPINTLAGVNNFFADTGDTEVVFKCSVNDYINAHSGGNLLGMGGVYLGGAKSGGSEEEPTEESEEPTEEPKEVTKTLGDEPISKK